MDKEKKICFVTTISFTMNAFIVDVAKFLHDQHRYDITFICDNDELFAKSIPEYIHYYPVPMKRGINFKGLRAIIQMVKVFSNQKFDIVQYTTPNASCYAAIAAWISHVPVRLYCQWGIVYVGFSGIKRLIFKNIEKLVCSLSTHIEPDSYSNLEYSIHEGLYPKEKGSVIWNGSSKGINLNVFDINKKKEWRKEIRCQYGILESEIVIGFIGRINKYKGINELLLAFKKLIQNMENTKLLIVGDIEDIKQIDPELYQWSTNSRNVIYTGFTTHTEKYFAAIDIFTLPSYREGFPNTVLESEAMGVPVVVTDIPGCRDAMMDQETGILIKAKDSITLAHALEKLILCSDKRILMGNNGHQFVKKNFNQSEILGYISKDRNGMVVQKK